jgi:hypothetical protein
MKKLLFIIYFIFSISSFGQTIKFATFEADIVNSDGPIYISIKDKVVKKLVKNSDGVYKDTLNVRQGSYKLFDGSK